MAFTSDSLPRRTLGPVVASAVIGVVIGVVAVFGVSIVTGNNTVSTGDPIVADDALLGGPEYGSRTGEN